MKVEIRFSKDEILVLSRKIAVAAEKVFYEGKEVREDKDFNNILKIEIVEEWGLKREDDFLYSPMLYVYLWEDTDVDKINEQISIASKPLWRKATVVVR